MTCNFSIFWDFVFFNFFSDSRTKTFPGGSNGPADVFFLFHYFCYRLGKRTEPFQSPDFSK